MKRLVWLGILLCLLANSALAQPAPEAEPLTGTLTYPQGSDAPSAAYTFTYRYPQFAGDGAAYAAINAHYQALAAQAAETAAAQLAQGSAAPLPGEPAYFTQVDYRVLCNSADYVSVRLTSRAFLGNTETERWMADVYALDGVYAGQKLTLSQAMGLEQAGDDAPEGSFAATLAYGLIGQIIQSERAMQTRGYFPDLTEADLRRALDPEHDFYLDGDGNIVFFIQSGEVAGEVEGVLTYPFAVAELLSAAKR